MTSSPLRNKLIGPEGLWVFSREGSMSPTYKREVFAPLALKTSGIKTSRAFVYIKGTIKERKNELYISYIALKKLVIYFDLL